MEIISFTKTLIATLTDKGCVGCFNFGAIINDRSALDTFSLTTETQCCTNVFIEHYKVITNYSKAMRGGAIPYEKKESCDTIFNLLFFNSSRADISVGGETDHPIEESRWANYIQPLFDCLDCDFRLLCSDFGSNLHIAKWSVMPEYGVSSNLFDGVRVEVIIRRYA